VADGPRQSSCVDSYGGRTTVLFPETRTYIDDNPQVASKSVKVKAPSFCPQPVEQRLSLTCLRVVEEVNAGA